MQETDINALAERYREQLLQDDRKVDPPTKDDDGNIQMVIAVDELNMLFFFGKSDPQFVRILLPNFYELELDDDKVNALVAMNHANATCKVAKINLNDKQNNVVASVEYLDHGTSVNKLQLDRYLSILVHCAQVFAKKMQVLKGGDEATSA